MLNIQRVSFFFEGYFPSTQAGFISPRLAGCQVLSHPSVWADVQWPTNSHSVGQNLKNETHFFLNHMCLPLFIYQSGLTLSHLILLWHLILSHLLFSYLIWSHLVTFVFWLFSSSYRILCYISMLRYRYTYHSIIVLWDILHPPF